MHKIMKSVFPTDQHVNSFQRLINRQIEEMRVWDKQMANVKKDPKKFHPYPAPMAHPDIMNSIVQVGKDYNIEFELVDDTPKVTLEDKKAMLANVLTAQATKLQEAIMPARKNALATIKVMELLVVKEEDRTPEQQTFLEQHAAKQQAAQVIFAHMAKMHDAIEDLTEDNIDDWKPETFPETK